MNKKQLVEKRDPDGLQRKFKRGPSHMLNPVPQNEREAIAHGNALALSGNYPTGTDECFNVGISGGCGLSCYVYQEGRCPIPEEMLPLEGDELDEHNRLYQ